MRRVASVFLVFCLFVSSCDKEPDRLDDYWVEFATLLKVGSSYRFQLDNGRLLVPEKTEGIEGQNGQRVILNYVPLQGDTIKVNYASPIFTAHVEADGYPERYTDHPVKIQSVWVSGDYLNLIMELEYHSKPHSLSLLRDHNASSIDLYLSHSRNGDPPGAPQVMHASFLLSSLRTGSGILVVPFRLFINTYTGPRVFELELK